MNYQTITRIQNSIQAPSILPNVEHLTHAYGPAAASYWLTPQRATG